MEILQGVNVNVKVWAPLAEVEQEALNQLQNITTLPRVFHHVAAMPDVHYGKGATVGSVIAMKDAVCPAAVGVDIGCGMAAIQTNLTSKDLPESLKAIRSQVERDIPVGFNQHEGLANTGLDSERAALLSEFGSLHESVQERAGKAASQLGTLGGGNHFIELCLDTEDRVWLMLHSGSRNIGKEIAEAHIHIAKQLEHNGGLVDPDLAFFLADTSEMQAYRRDLYWAQRYAMLNRRIMLDLYLAALRRFIPHIQAEFTVMCHHNYVAEEVHFGEHVFVTRKGAISAKAGEYGIIPGSMGARSFIVRGLGNPESFCSASHGAGRRMSRGAAKRKFTLEDLAAQTAGVECRKDKDVLDEIPGAYKDIEQVMNNQRDLVEVHAQLKQIMCVKG